MNAHENADQRGARQAATTDRAQLHYTPIKPRPCLVAQKFYKIFQIPRHIESLDICMKY